MRVFVHLAYGFDARSWNERYEKGSLLGINEPWPYGYHHANDMGCSLDFSRDHPEKLLQRGLRGIGRLLLGFDLLHAYRNRAAVLSSDVVWTHTESQHLAIAALLLLLRPKRRPKLIGQSVWLFDKWSRISRLRRSFYGRLMQQADALTFLSPLNAEIARRAFPSAKVEFISFGIREEDMVAASFAPHAPLRILSLGNDRDRDWPTLLRAFGPETGTQVRIASSKVRERDLRGMPHITIARARSNDELISLFDWADVVVVPLHPNFHASGITVVLEAVIRGKAVVSSSAGGLDAYFSDREITYAKPGDPESLRDVTLALARDVGETLAKAARAQAHLRSAGLTSRGFVERHVQMSRELLGTRRTL